MSYIYKIDQLLNKLLFWEGSFLRALVLFEGKQRVQAEFILKDRILYKKLKNTLTVVPCFSHH